MSPKKKSSKRQTDEPTKKVVGFYIDSEEFSELDDFIKKSRKATTWKGMSRTHVLAAFAKIITVAIQNGYLRPETSKSELELMVSMLNGMKKVNAKDLLQKYL